MERIDIWNLRVSDRDRIFHSLSVLEVLYTRMFNNNFIFN